MVETGEIRKRVRRAIDDARHQAGERRGQRAQAEQDGVTVLATVIAPVFKAVASALTAEGYAFGVTTPSGAVRMDAGPQDFIEMTLDTVRRPPALLGRVSRAWGRRVLVEEAVVREAPDIGAVTETEVVTWILGQISPFVER